MYIYCGNEVLSMKYFLDTTETMVEGLGFSHFDLLHLTWIAIFIAFTAYMCIIYRKADEAKRAKLRKIIAACIVIDELWKMFWLTVGGNYTFDYLPLHLCSINIFIIAYHAFIKPNKMLDNFLYGVCIPGAVAALLAPTWVKLPLLNFMHLHSFTVHILLATYPIMLVAGNDIQPDIKQVPKCILFTAIMAVPIYFINVALDTNFMFMMKADVGNPLKLFEPLGHHLIGVPIIYAGVVVVLYGPLYLLRKFKKA